MSREFYSPSDDDDNDDMFPEDIIHPSSQEKGRNASEFSDDLPLTRKGRIPRYLSKRTRRQRKAIAKAKAREDMVDIGDNGNFGFTDGFVLCLPCEDKAYEDDLFNSKCRPRDSERDIFQSHCAHPRLR